MKYFHEGCTSWIF